MKPAPPDRVTSHNDEDNVDVDSWESHLAFSQRSLRVFFSFHRHRRHRRQHTSHRHLTSQNEKNHLSLCLICVHHYWASLEVLILKSIIGMRVVMWRRLHWLWWWWLRSLMDFIYCWKYWWLMVSMKPGQFFNLTNLLSPCYRVNIFYLGQVFREKKLFPGHCQLSRLHWMLQETCSRFSKCCLILLGKQVSWNHHIMITIWS